jgi:hypothetical protein
VIHRDLRIKMRLMLYPMRDKVDKSRTVEISSSTSWKEDIAIGRECVRISLSKRDGTAELGDKVLVLANNRRVESSIGPGTARNFDSGQRYTIQHKVEVLRKASNRATSNFPSEFAGSCLKTRENAMKMFVFKVLAFSCPAQL